jgi:hypothetical protein
MIHVTLSPTLLPPDIRLHTALPSPLSLSRTNAPNSQTHTSPIFSLDHQYSAYVLDLWSCATVSAFGWEGEGVVAD